MSDRINHLTDREKILNQFEGQYGWIPHWGAEITTAVVGLEWRVLEAERFQGSGAAVSELAGADKYRVEAHRESIVLARPTIETRGLYPINYELVHEDNFVISAMARHLLFRDSHKRDKWPTHSEVAIARKAKPFVGTVKNLSTTKREGLWFSALKSEQQREIEWTGQLLVAHAHPNIADAIATYNATRAMQAADAA